VILAWILLLGAPMAAAVLAGRRCRRPGGSAELALARVGRGVAAGVLANLVCALFVTGLGTGTTAVMLKAAWLRHWLYHGELAGAVAYRHELTASQDVVLYFMICLAFPVIWLIMSALAMACFMPVPSQPGPQPGNDDGPGAPAPRPSRNPRPRAAASPTPRSASPSFHDRGQFGANNTRNCP
jgi:hypothetical protein